MTEEKQKSPAGEPAEQEESIKNYLVNLSGCQQLLFAYMLVRLASKKN